jgi:hypothetical protein
VITLQKTVIAVIVLVGIAMLGWLLSFPVGLITGMAPPHSWVYRGGDQIFYGVRIAFVAVALWCAIWIFRSAKLHWAHWLVFALAALALVYPVVLRIQAWSITR